MEGSGHFLVLTVGIHSQTGQIMCLLGATDEVKEMSIRSEQESRLRRLRRQG